MAETISETPQTEDEGAVSTAFVQEVSAAVGDDDTRKVRRLVAELHEADLADVIEQMRPDVRRHFVTLLGPKLDYSALTELEEPVLDEIIDHLPSATIAKAVRQLESDDAIYLLESLDEGEQQDILARIPAAEREALERTLDYPEDSAGRLMQSNFIAVPPFWSVGQTIDYMRSEEQLPNEFYEIFVIDPGFHLVGTVALNRLMRAKRPVRIEEIMKGDPPVIPVDRDQEEVAHDFKQYNLLSGAVVDAGNRVVGVITIDDVVDVIEEEAAEDIQRLGGVGAETVFDTIWGTLRGRFTWLLINLATAVMASAVIGLFDATINQMVALAVLMPIVASMGGNAGTQTMTVAVRALATRDLGPLNAARVITREAVVGGLNGIVFAIIVAGVAYAWFGSLELGVVIALAMLVNLFVAGLSGILIPLALDRMKLDPAIASSVFLTTVTDVVGFFAFLGLAALWLM